MNMTPNSGDGNEPKQKTVCTIRDGRFVEPCAPLAESTEYGNPYAKRKGVWAWKYHDKNGPSRTMFGVKSGQHVEFGFLFNFCPFCGARIDEPFSS